LDVRQSQPVEDLFSFMKRIGIFGLGNVLLADDGWGPYLVRLLEANYEFPENVELRDLGTPGQDLALDMAGLDLLIVLDSVNASGQPGELRRYGKEEILRHKPGPRLSPHDPSFKEALMVADLHGDAPEEVVLIGVIPDETDLEPSLSEAVRKSLPEAQEMVMAELSRYGNEIPKRNPPQKPDIWWEASGQE
jgi:hydrogenase maturation protease